MREGRFCAILIQTVRKSLILKRRDVRVVEGARLESVCRGNSTVGSNPTLSARFGYLLLLAVLCLRPTPSPTS
jgi:hypothetical protein